MKTKICKDCKVEKTIDLFHSHNSCLYGVRSECKDCHNKISRKRSSIYIKNNPEKRRSTVLKNKYGIDIVEYNNMLINQGGLCKICKTDNPGPKGVFSVDHCHNTNNVRGLLCYLCNVGLGSFKDNIESLRSAIIYLEGQEDV